MSYNTLQPESTLTSDISIIPPIISAVLEFLISFFSTNLQIESAYLFISEASDAKNFFYIHIYSK